MYFLDSEGDERVLGGFDLLIDTYLKVSVFLCVCVCVLFESE